MGENIPVAKVVATFLGAAMCGVETWLNAEHIAHAEGWLSSLVAVAITASIGAASALPLAEHALKTGQPAKGLGLVVFFLVMAGFSLSASVGRVGGKLDGEISAARSDSRAAVLAKETYDEAKAAVGDTCTDTTRGSTKCRKAQRALADARNAYQESPAERVGDPAADRIAAILPVTPEAYRIVQPLLLPFGLQLGGFLLLALGLAPGKPKPDPWTKKAEDKAAPTEIANEADAHRWLLDRILATPGRSLTTSGRELAGIAGIAPATFAVWLKKWAKEKKIVTARAGNKTVFTLPKLRQVT
jgi:hypothetical protein